MVFFLGVFLPEKNTWIRRYQHFPLLIHPLHLILHQLRDWPTPLPGNANLSFSNTVKLRKDKSGKAYQGNGSLKAHHRFQTAFSYIAALTPPRPAPSVPFDPTRRRTTSHATHTDITFRRPISRHHQQWARQALINLDACIIPC